ncbi:hypothetical protein SAMN04488128_103199 [Chitinophaga eiseniae]|uniref:Uncharacterized protein n=1 Tax=Chitinophaga eiseniae TaxID=634771 RepID=A0A1T4SP69_9BACT|nr:hypothetical protein SAMN04488128_103199 [Chitinophaga eiseniae]
MQPKKQQTKQGIKKPPTKTSNQRTIQNTKPTDSVTPIISSEEAKNQNLLTFAFLCQQFQP